MESLASIEDLVSLNYFYYTINQRDVHGKRDKQGRWRGKESERNSFLFDDLPSLDEQVSLESICTTIVVCGLVPQTSSSNWYASISKSVWVDSYLESGFSRCWKWLQKVALKTQ